MSERVALVTGAGRGIGAATAYELARNGATVAVNDIDLALAEKVAAAVCEAGGQAAAFGHDVSRPAQCEELVADVVARFGRLDILVNNAGIVPRLSIEDMTEEVFDRVVAVNLKSVFFLSRAAVRDMARAQVGPDRQHGFDGRTHRRPGERDGLQRDQGGHRLDDQVVRQDLRQGQHPGQRGGAGQRRYPDDGRHHRTMRCDPCCKACRSADCPSRQRSPESSRFWRPMPART